MIWGLFAAMALAVVAALLWPLLRKGPAPADRASYDLTVFRDQLDEIERDVARGVLTGEEAEAARLEIRRRMLAAAKRPASLVRDDTPQGRALLSAAVAVAVPLLALGLYMSVGAPQLPGHQTAAQSDDAHDAQMAQLLDKLAARMRAQPDDPQGWALLARSYRQMGRYADAADAYRNLMRLAPTEADGYAGFGEAAIAAASGTVTADARDAMLQALRIDRSEPRAQFYLGLERAQANEPKAAIAIWRALTAAAPEDAPWLPAVRAQMADVAQSANVMPMSVAPKHALEVFGVNTAVTEAAVPQAAANPSAPNVDALKGRMSSEQLAMIQGMVGGLAARLADNPDDYDGWMRLGRSYTVLNNTPGAKDAYTHAIKLKPGEIAPKMQLGEVLAQDGESKAKAGDAAGARKAWQDAMAQLPADAPLRGEIARRIAALK